MGLIPPATIMPKMTGGLFGTDPRNQTAHVGDSSLGLAKDRERRILLLDQRLNRSSSAPVQSGPRRRCSDVGVRSASAASKLEQLHQTEQAHSIKQTRAGAN